MSGFRDHFLDKYFAYRRRYVDYVAVEAPRRTRMAVVAEAARLTFVTAGATLCAVVFAPLVYASAQRQHPVTVVLFAALCLGSLWLAARAGRGVAQAWSDPRRRAESGERERTP